MDMHSLVTIADRLTPLEGELISNRLDEIGVRACLENVQLVTWLWHLSNAFGGVRLQVLGEDAELAACVLSSDEIVPEGSLTNKCQNCDESFENGWFICWRCGTDAEGNQAETVHTEVVGSLHTLERVADAGYPFLTFGALAVVWMPEFLLAFAFAALALFMDEAPPRESIDFQPDDEAAYPTSQITIISGNEPSRCALASAMFGFQWFPPLAFYSIYLLLSSQSLPVDLKAQIWRTAAWIMIVLSFPIVVIILSAMLFVSTESLPLLYDLFVGTLKSSVGTSTRY